MYAVDCVFEDHRSGLGTRTIGRDAAVEQMQVIASFDTTLRQTVVATRGERLALLRCDLATGDDFVVETLLVVELDAEGRLTFSSVFDPDDLNAALAELETRYAEAASDAGVLGPQFENAAFRAAVQGLSAAQALDWQYAAGVFADDVVTEDRRPGLGSRVDGKDAVLDHIRGVFEAGPTFTSSLVATRGERLCLTRDVIEVLDFVVESLTVTEIDAAGLTKAIVFFTLDQADDAYAELDRRFLASDEVTDAHRIEIDLVRAHNEREWQRFTDPLTDDFVLDDRRLASLGELGREEWLLVFRSGVEMLPDRRFTILTLQNERTASLLHAEGTDEHGNTVLWDFWLVWETRSGKLSRLSVFGFDAAEEAHAHASTLAGPRALENAATRHWEAFRDAWNSGTWDGSGAEVHADAVVDDRRSGLSNLMHGRESYVTQLSVVKEMGAAVRTDTIAVRGERLALVMLEWYDPTGRRDVTVGALHLNELDEDDLTTHTVVFDPDDLDAAFAELEMRYFAGEGAANAHWRDALVGFFAAFAARDWDRAESYVAPNLVTVDHRPDFRGRVDGSRPFITSLRSVAETLPDVRLVPAQIHRIDATCAVITIDVHGVPAGVTGAEPMHITYRFADGRVTWLETYATDDLDAAIARYDEIGVGSTTRGALVNAAIRVRTASVEALNRGDVDAYRSMHTTDCHFEDRRPGLRSVGSGPDVIRENSSVIRELGLVVFHREFVAVRGDRLLLERRIFREADGPDAFEVEALFLVELDEHERICTFIVFDPSDLDAAFAELNARYAAGEGAPFADILEIGLGSYADWNRRDWPALERRMAEDTVFVDHRPASLGRIEGREALMSVVRELLTPDIRHDAVAVHAIARDRIVAEVVLSGTNTDGGEVELVYFTVARFRDGVMSRSERFASTELDAALARFEELGEPADRPGLTNACSRMVDRYLDAFERLDWDAMAEALDPEVLSDDRRVGLSNRSTGRDALIAQWRVGNDVVRSVSGDASLRVLVGRSVIATRGERLAMIDLRLSTDDPAYSDVEVRVLNVYELGADGRITASIGFDPDDADAAYAELDERFAAGEAREAEGIVRLGLRLLPVWNGQNWDAVAALWETDGVFVDHRQLSPGEVGLDELMAMIRNLAELIPDVRHRVAAVPRFGRGIILAEVVAHGTNTEGGRVDFHYLQIVCAPRGRYSRVERFELDRYDEAVARYEELVAASATPELENACARAMARLFDAFERADWDVVADALSADALMDDRRAGLRAEIRGREASVQAFRVISDLGKGAVRVDRDVIATRGERLVLARTAWTVGEGDAGLVVVESIFVAEADADGRLAVSVALDADDLDAAFAELDERFFAGEGAPYAANWRLAFVAPRLFNSRDFDAYGDVFTDDFVLDDHRPAGWGREEGGPDARVAKGREMVKLSPDVKVYITEILAATSNALTGRFTLQGTSTDGNAFEIEYLSALGIRGGRVYTMDYYDPSDEASALARFGELEGESLGPRPDDDRPHRSLENDATRAASRFVEAFEHRQWDDLADLLSEDHVREDRRTGLGDVAGKQQVLDGWKTMSELGFSSGVGETLAIRRDTLCLQRWKVTGENDFEAEVISVTELDTGGRMNRVVYFDADDLDAAWDELNDAWLSGDASETDRLSWTFFSAYNARDWDAARRLLADGFMYVDHSPASVGVLNGADAIISHWRELMSLVADLRLYFVAPLRSNDRCIVGLTRSHGTDECGNAITREHVGIVQSDGGQVARIEAFAPEQLGDALARFEELGRARLGPQAAASELENAAMRAARRSVQLIMADDFESYARDLAPDVAFEDRRSLLRHESQGPEALLEQLRALRSLGTVDIRQDPLATRGERLALMRSQVINGDVPGFDVDALTLTELDEAGRTSFAAIFDPEDLESAFDELDERYVTLEGSAVGVTAHVLRRISASANSRDWEAFVACFADDMVFVDHQLVGFGESTGRPNAWGPGMTDLIPDVRLDFTAILAIDERGGVTRTEARGHDTLGNPIEMTWLNVGIVKDGVVVRLEQFPLERTDDALARFEGLVADPS